jgi:hypothetical protein
MVRRPSPPFTPGTTPVVQSLNVLSGLVISVAMQRRLLCVTGGDTCRKVVCHTLLP